MASYQEVFTNKLDWAMPFQRTGKFPLDRSSIFSSYDDALAYAKQDGSDSRKLGGTSYIGQIIAVYGNDAGIKVDSGDTVYSQEVAAYIITAVGESASLMKLAQTTASGDFSKDIQSLQTALSALEARVSILEAKPDDSNTEYEFYSADVTDGAIKYIAKDKIGNVLGTGEIQIKGWAELSNRVDNVVAVAAGRTKAYVYRNPDDEAFITAASAKSNFKVGDIIYFTDINIPDYWVSAVLDVADSGYYYTFNDLEATKVDLSSYQTAAQADSKYATKSEVQAKASQTDLNALSKTVSDNKAAADTSHQELQNAVDKVAEDLRNLDVSSQITAKINELDVDLVGGATNAYISSIKQEDGKIIATASTLPDFDKNAQDKADKALQDAKDYVDTQIGDLGESENVKSYVDTTVTNHQNVANQTITAISDRVKAIEDAKYGDEISSLKQTVATHTSDLSTITSRVSATEAVANKAATDISNLTNVVNNNTTTINNHATAIQNLQNEVSARVKELQIGGVKQTMSADGVINVTSISTDLLSQGKNTLIFDCLNASLTDN